MTRSHALLAGEFLAALSTNPESHAQLLMTYDMFAIIGGNDVFLNE